MARIIYSPLVGSMSGKMADAVAFTWNGINVIRQRVIPTNPNTAAQQTQRSHLARIAEMWRSLPANVQTFLGTIAQDRGGLSGYNVFGERNLQDLTDGVVPRVIPSNKYVYPIENLAAAAGAAGEITVTWDAGLATASHEVTTLARKVHAGEVENVYTFQDNVVAVSDGTDTITGLETGKDYEIVVLVNNSDDEYAAGVAVAETAG